AANENAVLACSALKRKYRELLRVNADVKFVFLHGSRARIAVQLKQRRGHFIDPALLDSQFADLEEPESSEDMLTIELKGGPDELVEQIRQKLSPSRTGVVDSSVLEMTKAIIEKRRLSSPTVTPQALAWDGKQ